MSEFIIDRFDDGSISRIRVRDAKLLFANFSGDPEKNIDNSSKRLVNLIVDDEEAYNIMLEDGWNFKTQMIEEGVYAEPFQVLDNGKVCNPRTELRVNYNCKRQPKIYLHTSANRKGILMDEDSVGELDGAYLEDVKLIINPNHWEVGTNTGTKGYINVMHCTIDDDPFASDYIDDDEGPFEGY